MNWLAVFLAVIGGGLCAVAGVMVAAAAMASVIKDREHVTDDRLDHIEDEISRRWPGYAFYNDLVPSTEDDDAPRN